MTSPFFLAAIRGKTVCTTFRVPGTSLVPKQAYGLALIRSKGVTRVEGQKGHRRPLTHSIDSDYRTPQLGDGGLEGWRDALWGSSVKGGGN